ncbi:hypothetical protein SRHO_G00027470 [Serrasalmus rhombeus]
MGEAALAIHAKGARLSTRLLLLRANQPGTPSPAFVHPSDHRDAPCQLQCSPLVLRQTRPRLECCVRKYLQRRGFFHFARVYGHWADAVQLRWQVLRQVDSVHLKDFVQNYPPAVQHYTSPAKQVQSLQHVPTFVLHHVLVWLKRISLVQY